MPTFRIAVLLLALTTASSTLVIDSRCMAGGGERCRQERLAALARDCAGEDAAKTAEAVTQLRGAGQDGLDAICAEHDRVMADHVSRVMSHMDAQSLFRATMAAPADIIAATASEQEPRIARLRRAIDAVARQRDAWASRLYWHTDIDQARDLAVASAKPILSLRMLGNLDEDLSCANSRFFRSVLYANRDVSSYLREHFILHWESLRPVPRLTIDFGDGRRIARTITGNSIHYILDPRGREIIDALPGLYAPASFLRGVQTAESALKKAMTLSDANDQAGARFLRDFHMHAIADIGRRCSDELSQLRAMDEAAGKAGQAGVPHEAWRGTLDDDIVARLAALPSQDPLLDQNSLALIRSKTPADFLKIAEDAQKLTASKRGPEAPIVAMLRTLHRTIAEDTVRNEYVLHRRIHDWLLSGTPAKEHGGITGFNGRVYAELFLTPLDDPWMGLAPRDAYAALDGGGLIDACR